MKKISRTIAVILVLVMLACSFTSCLSYVYRSADPLKRVVFAVVDIVFLPISLLALLIYIIISDTSNEMDAQGYLVNAEHNIYSEYYFLAEKIYSLSDEELDSLRQTVNSIPETERNASIERLNSLSETQRASLISVYKALPKTDIVASLERMRSFSQAELISLLSDFNSLSEEEIDSLIKEIKSLYNTEAVVAIGSREREYMELAFRY